MTFTVVCQLLLLAYHQVTTLIDFHPFNGARHYSRNEKWAEAGTNAVLMSLAPIGFALHVGPLMTFGAYYYFVLFGVELIIWWVPYLTAPAGAWRWVYNRALSVSTSDFSKGDTLGHWTAVYHRIHQGTITLLPARGDRPVPNVEHMILHALTLATALVTLHAYVGFPLAQHAEALATVFATPHPYLVFPL